MLSFRENIRGVTAKIIVKQIAFVMLLLTLCRLLWFAFNYYWLTPLSASDVLLSLFYGLYFDLPVMAIFYLPLWLWLLVWPVYSRHNIRVTKWLFIIPTAACLLLNSIDAAYSRITTRRSGYELFDAVADTGNRIQPYLIDFGIGIAALFLTLYIIYRIIPVKGDSLYLYNGARWFVPVKIVFAIGLFIFLARGGFRLKPLQSVDAATYGSSKLVPLIASTPLQMISTWGQPALPEYRFMSDIEAAKIVEPGQFMQGRDLQGMNVVVIIVESLGRDYTGFLNKTPFTPFLDSLSKKSLVFPFCYANGIRSKEMVPSVFCGIPSLMEEHYVNSAYAGNKIQNIFGWFGAKSYSTSFFHGATNGTMRFQPFLLSTGLQQYYGLDEYPYPGDYDGSWGIYDEPYLQYVGQYLDTVKKPFFSSVFTLSSHHPYKLPDKYKGAFPDGRLPIHRTVAYTDMAIRKFFEYAQTRPWFANTIFIITGDHTSHSTNPYFYSQTGHYEIPLLYYSPKLIAGSINKTVSQCDIMPTLIDLMGYENDWPSFGRSAMDSTYEGFSIHRDNGINYIIQYPYTLGMADDGGVTDYYLRFRNRTTITILPRSGERYNYMQKYLMAYLQTFATALRKNGKK